MARPYRRRAAAGPQRPKYSRAQQAEWLASSFISEAVGTWQCDLPDYPSISKFGKAVMAWAKGAPRPLLPEGTELVRGFDQLVRFIDWASEEREAQAQAQLDQPEV
jgi:hypothetical protein